MKIEKTKSDVEYTLVVDQDELDLLAALLGHQDKDTPGLMHLFNSMCKAGADYRAWHRPFSGDSYRSSFWQKVGK